MRALLVLAALAGSARAEDIAAYGKDSACTKAKHCFGIRIHVAHDAGGGFVVTPAWVDEQVAEAQRLFASIDVSFEIISADEQPAKRARIANREDRDALAPQVSGPVIHVFFTGRLDDIDTPGDEIRGVTWHARQRTYIVMSAIGKPRVLAHELGHFFGLPHSKYAISLMNKTPRETPPMEGRRFADEEIEKLRTGLAQILRDKVLVDRDRR